MPLSTRMRRAAPLPFKDKTTYLNASTRGTTQKFCHAIASDSPGDQEKWLTLVLGSGCASSRTDGNALVEALRGACARAKRGGQVDSRSFDDIVLTFGEALVRDRLRRELEDSATGAGAAFGDITDGVLDLLLSAALLSTLYFRIRTVAYEAPRRPSHADVAVVDKGAAMWQYLLKEYVAPCHAAVQRVQQDLPHIVNCLSAPQGEDGATADDKQANERLCETVKDVLQRIANGLDPATVSGQGRLQVRLGSVQSMAELAWLCLVTPQTLDVYPGWGDLLLNLSYDAPEEGYVGTPVFTNMLEPFEFIRSRYLSITRQSWGLRVSCSRSERLELYKQAASVLMFQHVLRTKTKEQRLAPPVTTAFVTSFDLELELSLLHAGKAFSVVLPVHSYDTRSGDDPLAKTCWVALRVPAGSSDAGHKRLDLLLNPDAGQWQVINRNLDVLGPIVVRLAGCPLIRLPRLYRGPDEGGEDGKVSDTLLTFLKPPGPPGWIERPQKDWRLAWAHAVVINEHDAGVQGMIDLITIPGEKDDGLPPDYASGSDEWTRFWMMLGVQVEDPALRQRISLVVSSLPNKHYQAGVSRGRGLAVNLFATELEGDLLRWHGFSVVRADVSEFTEDLCHYAEHMEKPWHIQFTTGECDV